MKLCTSGTKIAAHIGWLTVAKNENQFGWKLVEKFSLEWKYGVEIAKNYIHIRRTEPNQQGITRKCYKLAIFMPSIFLIKFKIAAIYWCTKTETYVCI